MMFSGGMERELWHEIGSYSGQEKKYLPEFKNALKETSGIIKWVKSIFSSCHFSAPPKCFNPLSVNPHKMVKHTQTILRLLSTNCFSVVDHFVGLALEGLKRVLHNIFEGTVKKSRKTLDPQFFFHLKKTGYKKVGGTILSKLTLNIITLPGKKLY